MQNPFHRVTLTSNSRRMDVNFTSVISIGETDAGDGVITLNDGTKLFVKESSRTLRGYTRKTWPAAASQEAEA